MIDRETLAGNIYAHCYFKPSHREGSTYISPKQAFKAADHFLKEAAKQREPKAECEHDWYCSAAKPYWHCAVCGERKYKDDAPKVKPEPPKQCEHEWATFNDGLTHCLNCDFVPAQPEPPKPERDISKCNHLWVSDGGECYYCQWCKIPKVNVDKQKVKPEPPKPERGAREFNLYKFADGELRAFPSDQATVVYAGFTAPIFICATREILPGDEK